MKMIIKFVFIMFVVLLMAGGTSATTEYISNFSSTYSFMPDYVAGNDPYGIVCLDSDTYCATPGRDNVYIQLPTTSNTVNLFIYTSPVYYGNGVIKIYNTSVFDEQTITYNNAPADGDLITTFILSSGAGALNKIVLTNPGEYIVIKTDVVNNQFIVYSDDQTGLEPYIEIPSFDPSGYVNDTNGAVLENAKVILSNATYSNTVYTDSTGLYNATIYANGTYNYNVTKTGFTTLSGSQEFTIGGTNYNFTLTPSKARVYGTIYEYTNESGSKSLVGDLKSIKNIITGYKKFKVYAGSTLTLPISPDGKVYVFKHVDTDISGDSATFGVLVNGTYIYFTECGNTLCLVEQSKEYRYKVSETATTELYLVLKIGDIYSSTSGEISWMEISPGFDVRQKTAISKWDLLYYWQTYFNSGAVGVATFFIDIVNWLNFSPDKPESKVTFNAETGNDAVAEMVMDFSSDTSLTTYSVTIRTANTNGVGKIGYGFTDDDVEVAPNYKDVLIQTGNNEYATSDYRKFSDTDTNGDKKIKVWLYFYSGYGSQWDFNYFVTAFCTGCNLKPLGDATVYKSYADNTKSNAIGYYNLYVPFGTYNISYSKDGYESKNILFTFDATNNVNNTDVTINKSTTNVTEQAHYIKVLPDPSNQGTATSAYYKTLNTYSYYKISICPFNDDANCLDTYDSEFGVAPNKESFVALKNYPIGTYSVYLSGKDFFDWSWSITAMNNFTIISTVPVANWEASAYYLGDTMKINVYVPSDSQTITVYYPNSTILFTGAFSAATTVQNKTFATNLNTTPGKYIVEITGNSNKSVTELLPISASNYNLSAPVNVVWGKSFTIQYTSPKTSELIILKSDGSPAYPSKTVTGSKSISFNTSSLENKADTLTVKLIQNNVEKAKTTITITAKTQQGQATNKTDEMLGSGFFAALIVLAAFASIGIAMGGGVGAVMGFSAGIIMDVYYGLLPQWALLLFVIIAITAFAVMFSGKVTGK